MDKEEDGAGIVGRRNGVREADWIGTRRRRGQEGRKAEKMVIENGPSNDYFTASAPLDPDLASPQSKHVRSPWMIQNDPSPQHMSVCGWSRGHENHFLFFILICYIPYFV